MEALVKTVTHIGLTVSDMDRSIEFYKNVLDLKFVGEMKMKGKETDLLFSDENLDVKVAYLRTKDGGAEIELIQFLNKEIEIEIEKASLFKTSISEICFEVEDIDKWYKKLIHHGVECLSKPQYFDATDYGFGKSKAIYFKDPDGIILELMEVLT